MSSDEQFKPLPRLTGTLRAFSRVSPRYDELSAHAERNLMKKRRERNHALQSSDRPAGALEPTWSNLVDTIASDKSNSTKFVKLKSLLDKLRMNMSKQFLNEDFNDAGLLNEASLFIMESFYDHRNKSGGSSRFESLDKLNKKLKEKFGQFQKNLFDQCRDLMEAIFSEIESQERLNAIDEFFRSKNVSVDSYSFDETNVSIVNILIFIHTFKFTYFVVHEKLLS